MITYETYESNTGDTFVKRTDNNGVETHIPSDLANSDYQRYLRWLENPDADESGTL